MVFSVSWLVDFQWGSCGSIFSFLCHGWQTFSGVRVFLSLVFCVMVGRLLVGFVWLILQFCVSWQVDIQWGSCGSIFSFLCHGWQTFSGVRVVQSLVFCVMVGRLLVGFVCFYLQFSVSWLVDFYWGSCGSFFSFLCHGWQTFSGIRVVLSLVFCVMVGRLLVGFVWLNLQFCGSWQVDFCGVRVAQFLVFCVMVGRLLVGFVWFNLEFSVSWLVDFQWGSCGSIFSFLCHGRQTFSGVRATLSLVFCVMVGRLLVGFVWLNLQFSVSWYVDFQWGSCDSIFRFLCHGWQTFIGVRVAQSLVFCVMVGRLLVGFVWLNLQISVSWYVEFSGGLFGSIFSFLCHGWQTFSGVRVAQSLFFCVMVGRLFMGFAWLNLQFSVSWLVDFQWGSCGSIVSFLCHGRQIVSGVRVAQSSFLSWLVDFQWGSCGSIFRFLCHGRQIFSGVRVAQSLVFCVMVGRLLVGFVRLNLQFSGSRLATFSGVRVAQSLLFCVIIGGLLVEFVWLNLQFSVSWLVDFQWASCVSIFSFLCHGWQTFSGVCVAQSLVFCVMVGRHLVGFVCLNLQFSVSWQVYFQWSSCGSIFSFLCHGWQTFSGVRVALFLVFCVIVGRLLVRFVWLNLQFSVSCQVDFQWGSCVSIFSFLCHGWQTFSGVRAAQSLVFCVMVDRLLVRFVWLNFQFSLSWLVDFQWGSCGSIFSFLCHGWQTFSGVREAQSLVFCVKVGDFYWGSCGSIFSFLSHGWQTFSGVRVAQSLVFCVMVGRLLVGFVRLNLQFSSSRLATFSWVRVAQSLLFCLMVGRLLVGSCGSIFRFLYHDWWTFSGVLVAQSFVFCVMVGRLSVGFVCLNLQFSVSWQVYFQWVSCGSNFSFLRHNSHTFRGVRVSQSLVFCVMVRGSIFSFLCHGRQTFSGVRVAQSLVFCVMVGRLVRPNLQFFSCGSIFTFLSHGRQTFFQWVSCGSNFSFLRHNSHTFRGVRVAQSLVFCVMVNLQFSASWLVDFQWGS